MLVLYAIWTVLGHTPQGIYMELSNVEFEISYFKA